MYNVYKHISKTFLTISIATLALSSCKSDKAENTTMAEGLFNKAQTALHSGNAHECITLLDSLDSNFIEERAIIQQSMNLRPQALLQIATEEIATTDSIIIVNKAKLDSLKPLMTHIDIPGTEGYSLVKTMVDPNFMNKTGISPRVSEIGEFYLVTSVNPAGGLKHWSVSAVVGNMIATSDTVTYDGALNFRINNSEVITFTPAGSNNIGELVANNPNLPVKIIFNGENGKSKSISLSPSQIEGMATAYRYALAINDMRNATINIERLNARCIKLQQQIDNCSPDTK